MEEKYFMKKTGTGSAILEIRKDFRKRHCGVPTCDTYEGGGGSFRLPEHPIRRSAWVKALNLTDTKKSVRICWKHFKISDFMKELDPDTIAIGQFGQLKVFFSKPTFPKK